MSGHWWWGAIRRTGWAPACVFVFYVVAAKFLGLYLRYPNLDIPTHFIGGLAISYFLFDAVTSAQSVIGPIPSKIRYLLVFTGVGTAAGWWEFYEFVYDRLFGTHTQLSVSDTMSDMFFGMAGSLVFLALRKIFSRPP